MSAIGRIGATYSQNAKTLDEYYDALNQGRCPLFVVWRLSRDDLLRRAVIMSIMCQGELDFESIELGHLIDVKTYFARELEVLVDMQAHGLVKVHDRSVEVTASWLVSGACHRHGVRQEPPG